MSFEVQNIVYKELLLKHFLLITVKYVVQGQDQLITCLKQIHQIDSSV